MPDSEEARLAERLITAEQDERRRLALFLHDGPVQSLAGIALMLDSVVHSILEATADQVFSIGTVNGIRQPIVVGPKVRNVPKEGYYAWDPGGYIGLYKPDTFWLSQ